MIYNLIVANKNAQKEYAYFSDEILQFGQVVKVQFGKIKKEFWAVCISKSDNSPSSKKLKKINSYTSVILDPDFLKFCKKMAEYNLVNYGAVLEMALNNFSNKPFVSEILVKSESDIILNQSQTDCVNQICNSEKPILLKGATGSGKTITALESALKMDGKVLIIAPEVALCANWEKVSLITNHQKFIYHYKVTKKNKKKVYDFILSEEKGIIIGTRSALLLPYKNLKMIIIDEEHSKSLKQDRYPSYNARDMAVLRCSLSKIKCVLLSATESLETYYNVIEKKYDCANLSRIQATGIADYEIVKLEKNEIIASKTLEYMKEAFLNHHQVLLFLNRKGYYPYSLCSLCYQQLTCKACEVPKVLYNTGSVMCNKCYKTEILPLKCPYCHENTVWKFYGLGVEKIQEEFLKIFPNKKVITITSDTQDIDNLMEEVDKKQYDCIIATEILAQGHDFKNIALSVIINADVGLNSIDFRAEEKIYQIWQQLKGRCGRHNVKGLMLVQTKKEDNKFIKLFSNEQAYSYLLEERKKNYWPPFSKCAFVIIKSRNLLYAQQYLKEFMPKTEDVYGPIYYGKLNYTYEWRILIKTSKSSLHFKVHEVLKHFPLSKIIKIESEIDPLNF